MRKFLVISFILLTLVACTKDKPGRNIIPAETLVPILVDLQLVYSLQSSSSFRMLSRKVDSIDTYSYVFEKHDVTKADFDSTISWYTKHPKLFTEVYDEVVMEISLMRDSLIIDPEI